MNRTWSPADLLAWVAAIAIGTLLTTGTWHLVFHDGGVHPQGSDGFYHLTRILVVVNDPGSLYEFDPHLHWPDGMWIVWPWGYDYLVGLVARTLSSDDQGAAAVAMFVPVALLWFNITLVAMLARRLLAPRLAILAVLAYAAAPATLANHTLGSIDHHAAEHSLWLATLYLAVAWRQRPASLRTAALLGLTLGVATAFHNGLFILQIPVLLTLLAARLNGGTLPSRRATVAFCAVLLTAQLLVLLPAHHFREFVYEFYYLSWFHLHVAALTCVATAAMRLGSPRSMWAMLAVGVALALPALPQALYGLNFMGARMAELAPMKETNSPFWGDLQALEVTSFYSGLIWLAPLLLVWALVRLARARPTGAPLAVLVFGVLGLLLMSLQIRFYQFGSIFLVLLPLMAFQQWFTKPRDVVYALILFAGAYVHSLNAYGIAPPLGGSPRYAMGYPLIAALEQACDDEPGLLLADQNWGNFLRYRTRCTLIANNFIMTAEDFEALARSRALLALSPRELRETAPEVRYVFAFRSEENRLGYSLLFRPLPPGYERLDAVYDRQGKVLGAAYRVLGEAETGSATEANGRGE